MDDGIDYVPTSDKNVLKLLIPTSLPPASKYQTPKIIVAVTVCMAGYEDVN